MMLLPDETEIKTLFQEQEMLEDDYERNVSSMDLKARNQMEVQIQKSVDHYEKSYLPWLVIISHRRSFNRRKCSREWRKVYMSSEDGFSSPLKVGGILRNTFIRRRTHSMESLLLTDWVCRLPIRNFHGLKAMLLFLRVLMETSLTAKHPCFFPSWRKGGIRGSCLHDAWWY